VSERGERFYRPVRRLGSGGSRLEEVRQYIDQLRGQTAMEAIPRLIEILGDESWYLRERASEALAGFGSPAAVAAEGLLRSGLWYSRAAALRVLGAIAAPATLVAVIEFLGDANKSIAEEAARAVIGFCRAGRAVAAAKILHGRGARARDAALGLVRRIDPDGAARLQRLIQTQRLMGPEGSLTPDEEARLALEVADEAWGVHWERLGAGEALPDWDHDLVHALRGAVQG
jgi:HEAT repeat protein